MQTLPPKSFSLTISIKLLLLLRRHVWAFVRLALYVKKSKVHLSSNVKEQVVQNHLKKST